MSEENVGYNQKKRKIADEVFELLLTSATSTVCACVWLSKSLLVIWLPVANSKRVERDPLHTLHGVVLFH